MSHKKLILSLCVLLTLLSGLHAQQPRWSLAVSAGAALPVGKFAGKNFYDSSQSLARLGPLLNIQLNYRVNPYFGLALLLVTQENIVDVVSMERQLENETHASYVSVQGGPWVMGKAMVGPTLSLPVGTGGKWYFTAKLMGGGLKTWEPKLAVYQETLYAGTGPGVEESQFVEDRKGLPISFVYLGGAGLKFSFAKQCQFRLDIDYSATTVKVPWYHYHLVNQVSGNVSTGYGGTPPPVIGSPTHADAPLPIATLNISAGLEFRL